MLCHTTLALYCLCLGLISQGMAVNLWPQWLVGTTNNNNNNNNNNNFGGPWWLLPATTTTATTTNNNIPPSSNGFDWFQRVFNNKNGGQKTNGNNNNNNNNNNNSNKGGNNPAWLPDSLFGAGGAPSLPAGVPIRAASIKIKPAMVKKKLLMAMKPAGDGHSYIIKLKENAIVGAAVVNMGDAIRKNSKNIFAAGVKKVTTVGRKKFLKVRAEKRAVEEVLNFNEVEYIEQDVQVSAAAYCATESNIASWGKDSLDKRNAVMDNKYSPLGNDGAVVRTYVVDSGVRQDHDEFTGRLILGPSYTNDNPQPSSGEDQFNHGTLVASAIAGNLYGASNKATLVSVRILDGEGNGFTSDLVTAIGYAITDCGQQQGIRCTINLSLSGGGTSQAAADAIEQAVQANIPVIGAAGNGGYDSCNTVPGSAPEAIVVGAVDNQFAFPSSISNYGTCIDILAAGVDILGASSFGPTATTTKSGTSFATAYVTGVVNDYLSAVPSASVLTVKQFLSGWATRNAVSNVPSGTDNVLLYVGCFW